MLKPAPDHPEYEEAKLENQVPLLPQENINLNLAEFENITVVVPKGESAYRVHDFALHLAQAMVEQIKIGNQ